MVLVAAMLQLVYFERQWKHAVRRVLLLARGISAALCII